MTTIIQAMQTTNRKHKSIKYDKEQDDGLISDALVASQAMKRYQIQRDYWRMRLIDTIEAYRRLDDD
tara:strand:- start:320 stop:520 length:201 start_codon:yes stop_codon:yes gene_type:complete